MCLVCQLIFDPKSTVSSLSSWGLQPFDLMAVLPQTSETVAGRRCVDSLSVLLSVLPPPVVFSSVGPRESSLAVLPVLQVIPLVHPAVAPGHLPFPLHMVSLPLTDIRPPVIPSVLPLSVNVRLGKLTPVSGAFCPNKIALSVLFARKIFSIKSRSISPLFRAPSLHHVLHPLPFIQGPVLVIEGAKPMSLVRLPLSFISLSIGVKELSVPFGSVVDKLAFIASPIGSLKHALPFPDCPPPLPGVQRSSFKFDLRQSHEIPFDPSFLYSWGHPNFLEGVGGL
mmetsp:Transcript_32978/g.65300  ORF Transcript_32978/g.65300 Transcript_32978/m.65300 type:complete len:282 (-) Transcript_32978:349-1194(-)